MGGCVRLCEEEEFEERTQPESKSVAVKTEAREIGMQRSIDKEGVYEVEW